MNEGWLSLNDDDFKLLRGFVDCLMDEQIFVIQKSLLKLKILETIQKTAFSLTFKCKKNKLKSLEVAKWSVKGESWWSVEGGGDEEKLILKGWEVLVTDICECKVAFATENSIFYVKFWVV